MSGQAVPRPGGPPRAVYSARGDPPRRTNGAAWESRARGRPGLAVCGCHPGPLDLATTYRPAVRTHGPPPGGSPRSAGRRGGFKQRGLDLDRVRAICAKRTRRPDRTNRSESLPHRPPSLLYASISVVWRHSPRGIRPVNHGPAVREGCSRMHNAAALIIPPPRPPPSASPCAILVGRVKNLFLFTAPVTPPPPPLSHPAPAAPRRSP